MSESEVRTLRIFQVDAFAERPFEGNPAAVCLLESELPDRTLQAIAAENNLSETAFFRPDRDRPRLRWFTPTEEVPLCGHATLAAGYVALERLGRGGNSISFESRSGTLGVSRAEAGFTVDLPRVRFESVPEPPARLTEGLGIPSETVLRTLDDPNYLVVVPDETHVADLDPDLRLLEELHPYGVAVSAPGREVDFVSRYFAPSYGIPEDPVTGSIHCALGPYWSSRVGKTDLAALQLSSRGGRLGVGVGGERVRLTGGARLYMEGEIFVETVRT